jgi:hypothetical protein
MTVEITDPTDGYLPDIGGNSWNVTAYTPESLATLNGYISDNTTLNFILPTQVQNNGNGYFTLLFNPSGANPPITEGDGLSIKAYNSNNPSDFDIVSAIASQNGGMGCPGASKQPGLAKKPKAKKGHPCPLQIAKWIPFTSSQGVHDIPITINQAAGKTGLVTLLLHNYARGHSQILHRYLHSDKGPTQTVWFKKVDVAFWDVIHVLTIPIPDPVPTPAGFHDHHVIKQVKPSLAERCIS